MRKLLNTLYITQEDAYLHLDGETLVCKMDDNEKFRIPFDNIEAIVCFNYLGCSPALMGKCVEKLIPITFISPTGRYLACVGGGTRGNVHLRVEQIHNFEQNGLLLAQNSIAAKIANQIKLIKRTLHDNPSMRTDESVLSAIDSMIQSVDNIYSARTKEEVMGIEGYAAHTYFSIYGKLFTDKAYQTFVERSKRPPLDPVNAVLSFLYTLLTNDYAAGLEAVGLDSYIGFYHALRSGRKSLACDLVEEGRAYVDRMVLTMFNLKMLKASDFESQISGAVYLNESGRKKVISVWQEKKRETITHPYLKMKVQRGLVPYIQSNLLAKYIRGEIDEYPCLLTK